MECIGIRETTVYILDWDTMSCVDCTLPLKNGKLRDEERCPITRFNFPIFDIDVAHLGKLSLVNRSIQIKLMPNLEI